MIDKDALLDTVYYNQPYQKEKDYIQELFLSEMYRNSTGIIFKGGTALSKFYGLPRFSDDLDFSILKNSMHDLTGSLDRAIEAASKSYPIKVLRKLNKKDILAYEISIRGPLFEMLNKYQHLKIEIDKNAPVIEAAAILRRNPRYTDLRPYVAMVMKANEILAEKVVALMFRHNPKARDLFDLNFLIKNGTEINVSLIDRKMRWHGHMFTSEKFVSRIDIIGKIWKKELSRLLPEKEFVDYKEIKGFVIENFKTANML